MKPNSLLIVRADGNETVGYGHVMRCCALAEEWQARGGQCVFVTSDSDWFATAAITQAGADIGFPAPHDFSTAMVQELADSHVGPVWVANDVPAINALAVATARGAGAMAMEFSDFDPMIDSSVACIRREIVAVRGKREIKTQASNVLLTTGGTCPLAIEVKLVALAREAGAEYLRVATSDDMPELLQWADVAISAAGHTAWELACVGLPAALVTIADNQIPVAERMVEAGAAISLGDASSLRRWFADPVARTAQRDAGLALVDGCGARRVVDMMLAEGDK